MEAEWRSWFQLSSPEVFFAQEDGLFLDLGEGQVNFRSPSSEVLDSVLESLSTSTRVGHWPIVQRILVAEWRWLLRGYPGLRWPSPTTAVRGPSFSARAEFLGQALSFTHLNEAITVWAIRDSSDVRWHRPEFLRPLLSRLLDDHGLTPAHGATLGTATHGVLLTNRGGSGKSTLTVAGVLRGLKTSGDDFLALRHSPSAITSVPLFSSAKLAPSSPAWRRLPAHRVSPEIDGKHTINLSSLTSPSPLALHKLEAVVIPSLGDSTVVREASVKDAWSALVPGSVGLTDNPHPMIRKLGHLASELPRYWLDIGDDLDAALDALVEIIP